MGNPIKVFLVDDHLLFRMGLKSALSDSGDRFMVTGEAASGAELLEHLFWTLCFRTGTDWTSQ